MQLACITAVGVSLTKAWNSAMFSSECLSNINSYYSLFIHIYLQKFVHARSRVSQALIMGTASIANALAFAPNLQKGVTAAKKIFLLLNRVPKIQDKPGVSLVPWTAEGEVDFTDVKFSYPTRDEILVLKGIIMNMRKGQKIALVGSSGCGKSTCIQLLQRFYDVDAGSVAVDNVDLRNLALTNLRRQLGIVSQEPILFDRSIKENIAYGDNKREVPEQEIIAAAKKANIHNFVSSLPLVGIGPGAAQE